MEIVVKHRGKQIELSKQPDETTTLGTLREEIATVIGSDASTTKILAPGVILSFEQNDTKLYDLLQSIKKRPISLSILASTQQAIASTSQPESDSIRLHDDISSTSTLTKSPYVARPVTTRNSQRSEYGFGVVEALPHYSDRSAAQAVLERLATDSGILAYMKMKKWKVGALREMEVVGKIGRESVILGYNKNMGEEIRLRIRTDNRDGFRSIKQLLHVLAHELAHNVESSHNVRFKETMRDIEQYIEKKDWRGSGGRVLQDGAEAKEISTQVIAARANANENRRKGNVGHSRLLREAEENERRNR